MTDKQPYHIDLVKPGRVAVIDLSKIYDESGNPITEGFGL